jgi:hypothetical protein
MWSRLQVSIENGNSLGNIPFRRGLFFIDSSASLSISDIHK